MEYANAESKMVVKLYVDGVWVGDLQGDGYSAESGAPTSARVVFYLQNGSPASRLAMDNLFLVYTAE